MNKLLVATIALVAALAIAAPGVSADRDRDRGRRGVSFSVSPGRVSFSGSYRGHDSRFNVSVERPRHYSYHSSHHYVDYCSPRPTYDHHTYVPRPRPVYYSNYYYTNSPRPVYYSSYSYSNYSGGGHHYSGGHHSSGPRHYYSSCY